MEEEQSTMNDLPYLDTLGIQLWTVRNQMEEDPVATLTALADIGYRQVELMDTRHIADLKPICDDLGLAINSSFMLWTTLTGRWDLVPQETERFAFEQVLEQMTDGGLSHLVFGYLQPGERETADDWKRRADELNVAGEKARDAGLQMAYHNHNFEWAPVGGTTGFDILRDRLEAELVPFELDLAWVAMAGQDASETLAAVGDRTELVHIKNLVELERPYLTIPEMPDDRFTELGAGQLDIPALMRQAREIGATYCFYEQDNNWKPDALASARKSYAFLAT
jgi:sugar phosphate isomerase/epimerase